MIVQFQVMSSGHHQVNILKTLSTAVDDGWHSRTSWQAAAQCGSSSCLSHHSNTLMFGAPSAAAR